VEGGGERRRGQCGERSEGGGRRGWWRCAEVRGRREGEAAEGKKKRKRGAKEVSRGGTGRK